VLYYRYEEEKDQHPKAPELDRSRRALSSRWSDEEPQEGSEQKGMPWKGARMRVGDALFIFGFVFVGIPVIGLLTVFVEIFRGVL
jgi:hypothetical protein